MVKPCGRILLFEHVRPRNPLLGRLADLLTPPNRGLFGFALNRTTEENIERGSRASKSPGDGRYGGRSGLDHLVYDWEANPKCP